MKRQPEEQRAESPAENDDRQETERARVTRAPRDVANSILRPETPQTRGQHSERPAHSCALRTQQRSEDRGHRHPDHKSGEHHDRFQTFGRATPIASRGVSIGRAQVQFSALR